MTTRAFAAIMAALSATLLVTACEAPHDPPPLTIAVTASMAEPAPWSPELGDRAVEHALRAVRPGGGAVSLVVAGNPEVATVDLTPLRGNEVEQDRETARTKSEAAVPKLRAALTSAQPASGGLDLLGTYRRAIEVSPPSSTVIVVSSGGQTTDPLDLRRLGWSFDVAAVVGDLSTRGLIADAHGRDIQFLGLGVTYGSQPTLPLPASMKLIELWQAICHASHAASCTVLTGDLPRTPPTSTQPVPVLPADPTPTTCQGSTIVPGTVTFDGDSDVLVPSADEVLAPIAHRLAQCPADRVATFTGHTAQVTSGDPGVDLATRRAEAVRSRVGRLGAPASVLGPAVGAGSAHPLVDNLPGGHFSESLARLNRRVEITITAKPKG